MLVSYQNISVKEELTEEKYKYSICSLVTDVSEYDEMLSSFITAGFDTDSCEYRHIDNTTQNSFDGYTGLNLFLQHAQGKYIILCHQDILLNFDNREVLEKYLSGLDNLDPNWAIASNAGGIENSLWRRAALNVFYPVSKEHPQGYHHHKGKFPQKAISVDESFIIVKRSANLSLSHDIGGFHLYGTDLCLVADLLGYTAYVIDFKLTHKSWGSPGESFKVILKKLIAKYTRFITARRITTTITDFYLSPSATQKAWAESKFVRKVDRKTDKIKTLRKKGHGY